MITPRTVRHPTAVAIACCTILLVSLVALTAAFVSSLNSAGRHFDRAGAAQTQLAAVSRIETLAGGRDSAELLDRLDAYARSIRAETALLPAGSVERADQAREAADAARLRALAADPGKRAALSRLVAAIVARERGETARVGGEMDRLRTRTTVLAILIALAAGGAALLGALGLIATNRRLSHEVAARTADLTAIDASRRLFFAKVSHEMRTPVTVMRGEAEVALADPAPDTATLGEALRHVVANAEFLEHRIAELLGLARADDGQLHLDHHAIDLVALVRDARSAAGRYARSAEVTLVLDAPAAPLTVRGDARWLRQAVLAVIDNAVKFSPLGATVDLVVARERDAAVVRIADHGAGVASEALPRIFDAYYQADEGRSRGGTGLGLALARWVVERHDGTIGACNRGVDGSGNGCTVAIRLPAAA